MKYPKAREVLVFTMECIGRQALGDSRSKRRQVLTQSLVDRFGFTIKESKQIVDKTYKVLDSIPVEVIDVHRLWKERG